MTVFDSLRSPTRHQNLSKNFPHGCHWHHVVANCLATVIVNLDEALLDCAELRRTPRIALPRYRQGMKRCVLTVSLDKRRKRVPVALGEKDIIVGDRWIVLNDSEGPLRLVNALIDVVEDFWISNGH